MTNHNKRNSNSMIIFIFLALLTHSWFNTAIAKSSHIHVLSIADIHFDPFSHCSHPSHCRLVEKLAQQPTKNWESLLNRWSSAQFSPYFSDSNWALLKSALSYTGKLAHKKHVDVIVINGDFIAHKLPQKYHHYFKTHHGYKQFINKIFSFMLNTIKKNFPKQPVFIALGNNDSDSGDYQLDVHDGFLNHIALNASPLLPQSKQQPFIKQFTIGGYYRLAITPNIELISLNSTLNSNRRSGPGIDKIARKQMAWLKNQLQHVRRQHKVAWLMWHIPVAINAYNSLSSHGQLFMPKSIHAEMLKVLSDNQDIIAAIFTAHIHADTYFSFAKKATYINQESIPAISPVYSINPSFKLYKMSSRNGEILDYTSYYLPLSDKWPKWQKAYRFSDYYRFNCKGCRFLQKRAELLDSRENKAKMLAAYHLSSPVGVIGEKNKASYLCATKKANLNSFKRCRQKR